MLSRILGVILLVVAIVGIVFSIAGAWVSWQSVDSVIQGVDSLGNAFDQTLGFVSEGLDLEAVSGTEAGAMLEGRASEIIANIDQAQVNLNNQLRTVRLGLLLLFIWFGLTQLLTLYIGADLLADGKLGSRLLS
jgi:ABC-type multidrug transport system fused ATPase/permease subunit